jgi:hypothetical protein
MRANLHGIGPAITAAVRISTELDYIPTTVNAFQTE